MPPKLQGIRTLEDQALQAALDRELARLDPEARGAVFAYVTPEGGRLRGVIRLSEGWSVMGDFEKRFDGPIEGGLVIRRVW